MVGEVSTYSILPMLGIMAHNSDRNLRGSRKTPYKLIN